MQNLAFSEVLGGPYCNSDVNSGTETSVANLIFVVTCDNLQQSRIQCMFYMDVNDKQWWWISVQYSGGNKFQLMLLLLDEFNNRTDF